MIETKKYKYVLMAWFGISERCKEYSQMGLTFDITQLVSRRLKFDNMS